MTATNTKTAEIKANVEKIEETKTALNLKGKEAKVKKSTEPKIKLGAFAVQLMLKGKTNEQVLKECKKRFPKSSVSDNSIAWYRSTARKDGLKIKTDRELTAKK